MKVMANLIFIRRIVFSIMLGFISANAQADPSEWLMKINDAAVNTNFSGTFIYIHDGEVEAMEVTRKITDDLMQERLYALNGEPREIIRDQDKVWCYIPDKNVVVHDYRQVSESGFPRILPGDLTKLKLHYHFEEGDTKRIADRAAKQIKVIPNDSFRYGYSLWADMDTGLLLRSDLLNQDNEIVEQYLFVDVEINGEIDDAMLQPVSNTEELQLFGNTIPMPTPTEPSKWSVTDLPDGYELNKHIRRMSPMGNGESEHLVFTDGLSTVSVFIKKANENQSELTGLSRMGAVHAYRTKVSDHRITVMGEVPAGTVKLLAEGVTQSAN